MPRYYVHVEASVPKRLLSDDDKHVPGIYAIDIHQKISLLYQHCAVMEEFHNDIAIENLDDFNIVIRTGKTKKCVILLDENETLEKYAKTDLTWLSFIALSKSNGLYDYLASAEEQARLQLHFSHWSPLVATRSLMHGPLDLCMYSSPEHLLLAIGRAIKKGMPLENAVERVLSVRPDVLNLCMQINHSLTYHAVKDDTALPYIDLALEYVVSGLSDISTRTVVQICEMQYFFPKCWSAVEAKYPSAMNGLTTKLLVYKSLFAELHTSATDAMYSASQLRQIEELLDQRTPTIEPIPLPDLFPIEHGNSIDNK